MEAPFLEGVPYLSREEEASARRISLARQNRDAAPDIKINAEDLDSLEFVGRVRHEIQAWQNRVEVSLAARSCRFELTRRTCRKNPAFLTLLQLLARLSIKQLVGSTTTRNDWFMNLSARSFQSWYPMAFRTSYKLPAMMQSERTQFVRVE